MKEVAKRNIEGNDEKELRSKTYGYARVSAKDQNLDRQMDALLQFPVQQDFIFTDKASGKDFKRPASVSYTHLTLPTKA